MQEDHQQQISNQNTRFEQIFPKAIEILEGEPNGLRYSELRRRLVEFFPGIPRNTIHSVIYALPSKGDSKVYKPSTGIYRHVNFKVEADEISDGVQIENADNQGDCEVDLKQKGFREEDLYQPFADFLLGELEECTAAIPLGRKIFGAKWQTPDVIGKWESPRSHIIKSSTEIVSAEIKLDKGNFQEAFGQACSYKLFSHKVYLVLPQELDVADKARIVSLCEILGIGLVFFSISNPSNPEFKCEVKAAKSEPNMRFANLYLGKGDLEQKLFN